MKFLLNLTILSICLICNSACNKKNTIKVLFSPVDTLSSIMGKKQWIGRYIHQEYNSTRTHVDWFESDTSLSFTLTMINDSVIICSSFGDADSLFYVRTDEMAKYVFYHGDYDNGNGYVLLTYNYSVPNLTFKTLGSNKDDLLVQFKLSTQ